MNALCQSNNNHRPVSPRLHDVFLVVDDGVDAVDRVLLDFGDVLANIENDHVSLVGLRNFEDTELARYHVGTHVVVGCGGTSGDALDKNRFVGVQEDEVDQERMVVVGGYADDVAVLALQRRAGEYDAVGAACKLVLGFFPEQSEPVPAVSVGERNALRHLVDVGLGVELQARGQQVVLRYSQQSMPTYIVALYVR